MAPIGKHLGDKDTLCMRNAHLVKAKFHLGNFTKMITPKQKLDLNKN